MKNFCAGCGHWKKGDCDIAYRGAKSKVVDDFEIVVGCDNFSVKKAENHLCVNLTGRDYFYVKTVETTAEAALEQFKKALRETATITGFDYDSAEVVITKATLLAPNYSVIDELKRVPAKPCVPIGNCQRCVNTFGTFGCWSTVSNIPQYNCEEGQRLFSEKEEAREKLLIDPALAVFNDYYKSSIGVEMWFDYPSEYINTLEQWGIKFDYDGVDPKTVVCCCVKITMGNDGEYVVEASPTVSDGSSTSDVDYAVLQEGVHYSREAINALIAEAEERCCGSGDASAAVTEETGPKSDNAYKPCSLLWMLAELHNAASEAEIRDGMLRIAKYIDCCRKAGCTLDIDGRLVLPVGSLHTFDSHGADSKLKHRDGDVVQIECLLDDNEYDPAETGLMYSVVFNDGHIGEAFEDELIPGLAERH